jgi:hypothetical protein
MQRLFRCSLVLAAVFLTPALSRAGVYNLSGSPDWPSWPLPANPEQFKFLLSELRDSHDRFHVDPPRPTLRGSMRESLEKQFAELDARWKKKTLQGTRDRIDLSACLIRMGRNEKAIQVLEDYAADEMKPDDPLRFLVFANLAMAYMTIAPNRAIEYQEEALGAWPRLWAEWSPAQLAFYRRCETYFLALLQSRERESTFAGGRWDNVDPLFPKVKFIAAPGKKEFVLAAQEVLTRAAPTLGSCGIQFLATQGIQDRYDAGGIDPRMADEYPPGGHTYILQLALWLPEDDRLIWLLAEALNAEGDIPAAADLMDDLVRNRQMSKFPTLFKHRQILAQGKEVSQALVNTPLPLAHAWLFFVAHPRSGMEMGGVGGVVGAEHLAKFRIYAEGLPPQPPPAPAILPFWKEMIVGFFGGCLVTILVRLQMSQRRKPVNYEEPAPEEEGTMEPTAPVREPGNVGIPPGHPEMQG